MGFSSKLLAASKASSSLRVPLLHHGVVTRSTSTAAGSGPESTEAAGSVKLGFSSGSPGPSAVDLSSFAAAASVLKSRDVVDFAKHYGRCYWELSKARLRFAPFCCVNPYSKYCWIYLDRMM